MTQRRKNNTAPAARRYRKNPVGRPLATNTSGSVVTDGNNIKTKSRRIIPVWWIPAVVVFVAVMLAQMAFPETLRLMEATNFYVATPEFFSNILALYPGLNALLNAWLLQFFCFPVVGALIEALLLSLITLLATLAPMAWDKQTMGWGALIPALVIGALFPNDLTLQIQGVVFFLLFAVVGRVRRTAFRVISVVVCGVASFFLLSFPLTVLLFLGLAAAIWLTRDKEANSVSWLVPAVVALLMIGAVAVGVMISNNALGFIPLDERWLFVRDAGDKMWWYLLSFVLTMLLWLLPWPKVAKTPAIIQKESRWDASRGPQTMRSVGMGCPVLTLALSVAAGLFIYFHTTGDENAITSERMFRYSQMAERGDWQQLLNDILLSSQSPVNASGGLVNTGTVYNIPDQLDLELALLCEARLHTLPEHLFLYPINTPESFVPRFDDTPFSNNFCRIFYRELGLWDEAYHRAFQYGMGVQVNGGFCMASLRQMAIYAAKQGDSALTDKLTYLLSRTTLHRGYVASVRDTLQSALRRGINPASDTVRADNFVGGYAFPSEVVRLLELHPQNRDYLDYLLCGLLLRKQLDNFNTIIHAFPIYASRDGNITLPRAYAEAAAMIEAMRPGTMRPMFQYDPAYDEQMREFQRLRRSGEDDSAFRGTFWYYYVYAEIPPLRDWNPQAASS